MAGGLEVYCCTVMSSEVYIYVGEAFVSRPRKDVPLRKTIKHNLII